MKWIMPPDLDPRAQFGLGMVVFATILSFLCGHAFAESAPSLVLPVTAAMFLYLISPTTRG